MREKSVTSALKLRNFIVVFPQEIIFEFSCDISSMLIDVLAGSDISIDGNRLFLMFKMVAGSRIELL
jgi:hypothetical protein